MNQRRLFTALDALPWQQIAIDHATIDRGHNRIDVRTIKTLPPTDHIRSLFPHVEQVFLLERYSYTLDGTPLGAVAVLGITSLPATHADAAAIAAYIRGHWSIESLHWIRDPYRLPPLLIGLAKPNPNHPATQTRPTPQPNT